MTRTALPLPPHLILFGTEKIGYPGLGFRFENKPNNTIACFFLRALGNGCHDTTVAFPMTLDQIRDLGLSCIAYAVTGNAEDVVLSHGPVSVVINDETMACSSFVFTRINDTRHLMVFRHPCETEGDRLKPLVQVPLSRDQFRDLGIRCILYAETH